MSEWVDQGIPAFAVVGRVNSGKTATLATLLEVDDNEILRISATPGETTRVQPLPVRYHGTEWIRFLDTPGFQQPVEAMREIQRLSAGAAPGLEQVRRFVTERGAAFPDEARLLEPILQGAGVLYVVDSSKPLRDSFVAEMEILRWTGRPRLALLNPQEACSAERENDWRERLGAAFNLVRTFDAHAARYQERRRLLEALLQIEESSQDRIARVLEAMSGEWEERREEATEAIMEFLEQALPLRVSAALDPLDEHVPSRNERKQAELKTAYFEKLVRLEAECLSRLLTIYRHHLLTPDVDPSRYAALDLETVATWRKWGLSRWQLTAAGALAGGTAGAVFDVGVGAHSLGAGTVLGAIGGGTAALLKGGSLPELRLKVGGGVGVRTSGGRTLVAGPPASPNFPWILLDSMLLRHRMLLARAHGRRDAALLSAESTQGLVRELPSDRRRLLQRWFTTCLKGTPDPDRDPDVFLALRTTLEELEAEA